MAEETKKEPDQKQPLPEQQPKQQQKEEIDIPPPEELEFEVMPHAEDKTEPQAPVSRPALPKELAEEVKTIPPSGKRHWLRWVLIAGGAVLLVVVGWVLYLNFFASYNSTGEAEQDAGIDVPETSQTEPVDTDSDGLADSEETAFGTDPNKADTDGDGLADGDEVNVYGSDPLLSDTDSDNFDDGTEVGRGYSPVVNTSEKAESDELELWARQIAEFGLHEPTKTTLALKRQSLETKVGIIYENEPFGYQVEVPNILAVREDAEGRNIGIYISGFEPDESDVLTDPISIGVAVKVEGQSLEEWVGELFQPGLDYESSEEVNANGNSGIRLKNLPGRACPSDLTLFAQGGTVIMLNLQCNETEEFVSLYDQIVNSFRFTE